MSFIKRWFCISMMWFRIACVVALSFSIALVALLFALAKSGALVTHYILH